MSIEAVRFYPLDQWPRMAENPDARDEPVDDDPMGWVLINQSLANISLSGEAP
jgi:hypothetical protein